MIFPKSTRRGDDYKGDYMSKLPETEELTKLLQKLGIFVGSLGSQWISVVKNFRDNSYSVQLDLQIRIPADKYKKLIKLLEEL